MISVRYCPCATGLTSPFPIATETDPGAFLEQLPGVMPELVPEGICTALLGPFWINGTFALKGIEKAAQVLPIDPALLQGQPALDQPQAVVGKVLQVHSFGFSYLHHLVHGQPHITVRTAAAGAAALLAGFWIK